MMGNSNPGFSNHVVAIMAGMTHIVASLYAERNAAKYVASDPAAEDACAELRACYF